MNTYRYIGKVRFDTPSDALDYTSTGKPDEAKTLISVTHAKTGLKLFYTSSDFNNLFKLK